MNKKNIEDKNVLFVFFVIITLVFNGWLYLQYTSIVDTIGTNQYVYPLDDTYIHMAIAKSLAFEGVWGVNGEMFTSASSSLLYTILNALLFFIFGDNEYIPLFINVLFANLLILGMYKISKNVVSLCVGLFLFITMLLVYNQVFSGMEHLMHCFFIGSSLFYFLKYFYYNQSKKIFLIFTMLALLSRYETIFIIIAYSFVLLYHKQWKLWLNVMVVSILPIMLFGWYSIYNGGAFFPNSILIKGETEIGLSSIMRFVKNVVKTCIVDGGFLTLFVVMLYLIRKELKLGQIKNNKLIIFFILTVTFVLHMFLASVGWFYRYEAYLYVLFILGTIYFINQISPKKVFFVFLSITMLAIVFNDYFFIGRFKKATNDMKYAGKNIHDQQVQMAKFVTKYYNNAKVAINDLGAVAYYSDADILDLVGLGSNNVMRLKRAGKYNGNTINELLTDRDLIIIYDEWYEDSNLEIIKVAEMTIQNNVICGYSTVNFYCKKNADKEKLKNNLINFEGDLPKDVTLRYID